MAHPYDDNGFRHYLKFCDFDMDWYEIAEPVGFDGAKYVKKQLPNRWTRDVEYFAIDGLTFPDAFGDILVAPRVYTPQGDTSNYMDYGFRFLMENRRLKGSEMKVGYKISRNGVDFREFELDNRDEDLTDGLTYYKCKLVEIGLVADHFRNLKNTFDAFSDKNFKDETITPINSFNYLIKATPLNLTSIFKMPNNFSFDVINSPWFGAATGINPSQQITESGVNNTLGWLLPQINTNTFSDFENFALMVAVKDTNNVKVSIDIDMDYEFLNGGGSLTGNGRIQFLMYVGTTANLSTFVTQFYAKSVGASENESGTIKQIFTFEINEVPVGQKIFLFHYIEGVGDRRIKGLFRKHEITLEVVETDLDIVCPAVRYIDLIKQGGKFVNNLPVVAPRFDIGGQFYSQAVFSRSLLEQRKEMYSTNEDLIQSLQEVCADAEISKDNIDIRQHQDFYQNNEIASFLVIPSEDYTEPYDEYYLINNFNFGYKNFEQDRTTKNTVKSFHTSSEWLPKNERSDKNKKIENELIRDPFLKQTTFNLAIKNPSTSTEKDEKLFIEDMVTLAPNSSNEFVRTLLMRWQDGKLEILNRNTLGTNEDAILNWNNLGLAVGASFIILSGANVGNYTIFSINTAGTTLTLTPIGSISQASGNYTIRIKHFYSNVLWQTRIGEGFTKFEKGYSNQFYTIKRNMKYWYYYLGTATMYCKKDIKNSFFKNFGKLETQLDSETTPVIEDATILYADLPNPLVEPITIKAKIVAQYEDVLQYLENYRTIKGFVRLFTPTGKVVKVYPKDFQYTLSSSEAVIQGEKKYETQYLKIDIVGNIVNVDDAPYDLQGVAEWFRTQNDFIQLYDKKSNPLSNFYRYDFVLLNDVKYNSITELVIQLNLVEWT
jgi:hypothetical protein